MLTVKVNYNVKYNIYPFFVLSLEQFHDFHDFPLSTIRLPCSKFDFETLTLTLTLTLTARCDGLGRSVKCAPKFRFAAASGVKNGNTRSARRHRAICVTV